MKLWYQSLARQTESTPYGKLLRATIADAADSGQHALCAKAGGNNSRNRQCHLESSSAHGSLPIKAAKPRLDSSVEPRLRIG